MKNIQTKAIISPLIGACNIMIVLSLAVSGEESISNVAKTSVATRTLNIPQNAFLSGAKKKIIEESYLKFLDFLKEKASPETVELIHKKMNELMAKELDKATEGIGSKFKNAGKDAFIDVFIGVLNELAHTAITNKYQSDDSKTVLIREQLLLWTDVATEALVYNLSDRGVVAKYDLVKGMTEASGKRVITAINTGLEIKEAIKGARDREAESALWREVLDSYVTYAGIKDQKLRDDYWREVVLYKLSNYAKWVAKYHSDNDNRFLLAGLEKRKFWLKKQKIILDSKYHNHLYKQKAVASGKNGGDKLAQHKNEDVTLADVANHNANTDTENTDNNTNEEDNPPTTDGGDGNTDGDTGGETGGGDGNTGGETTGGGEGNTGGGNEITIGNPSSENQRLFYKSLDATGFFKFGDGLVSNFPSTSITDANASNRQLTKFDTLGTYSSISWGSWEGIITEGSPNDPSRLIETQSVSGHWIEGKLTTQQEMPLMGKADYTGVIVGYGKHGGHDLSLNGYISGQLYDMKGEFTSSIDFSQSGITHSINKLSLIDNTRPDLDIVTSNNPVLISKRSIQNNYFNSHHDRYTSDSTFTQFALQGNIYGADANAIGGAFSANTWDEVGVSSSGETLISRNNSGFDARGIFVGEKQTTPPVTEPTLIDNPHAPDTEGYYIVAPDIFSRSYNTSQNPTGTLVPAGQHSISQFVFPQSKGYTEEKKEHLSWGRWEGNVRTISNSPIQTVHERGYWIAGQLTPLASIPRSGTATYNGSLRGTVTEFTGVDSADITLAEHYQFYDLTGSLNMVVDFGNTTVNGNISNLTYNKNGQSITWLSNGTLNGNVGNLNNSSLVSRGVRAGVTSVEGITGSLKGDFFGPNAEEVGGTFNLIESSTKRASGIFWGEQ